MGASEQNSPVIRLELWRMAWRQKGQPAGRRAPPGPWTARMIAMWVKRDLAHLFNRWGTVVSKEEGSKLVAGPSWWTVPTVPFSDVESEEAAEKHCQVWILKGVGCT